MEQGHNNYYNYYNNQEGTQNQFGASQLGNNDHDLLRQHTYEQQGQQPSEIPPNAFQAPRGNLGDVTRNYQAFAPSPSYPTPHRSDMPTGPSYPNDQPQQHLYTYSIPPQQRPYAPGIPPQQPYAPNFQPQQHPYTQDTNPRFPPQPAYPQYTTTNFQPRPYVPNFQPQQPADTHPWYPNTTPTTNFQSQPDATSFPPPYIQYTTPNFQPQQPYTHGFPPPYIQYTTPNFQPQQPYTHGFPQPEDVSETDEPSTERRVRLGSPFVYPNTNGQAVPYDPAQHGAMTRTVYEQEENETHDNFARGVNDLRRNWGKPMTWIDGTSLELNRNNIHDVIRRSYNTRHFENLSIDSVKLSKNKDKAKGRSKAANDRATRMRTVIERNHGLIIPGTIINGQTQKRKNLSRSTAVLTYVQETYPGYYQTIVSDPAVQAILQEKQR